MNFHYLARGVLFVDGRFLLAHQKGAGHTFLPGGHIARGEKAGNALIREFKEETGLAVTVHQFIGVVEYYWMEAGQANHEVNLIFELGAADLRSASPVQSQEGHLEFIWSEPGELKEYNLLPYPMIECLLNWHPGYSGFWGTW
jgi:8-oxo-dGTP diphosphatase